MSSRIILFRNRNHYQHIIYHQYHSISINYHIDQIHDEWLWAILTSHTYPIIFIMFVAILPNNSYQFLFHLPRSGPAQHTWGPSGRSTASSSDCASNGSVSFLRCITAWCIFWWLAMVDDSWWFRMASTICYCLLHVWCYLVNLLFFTCFAIKWDFVIINLLLSLLSSGVAILCVGDDAVRVEWFWVVIIVMLLVAPMFAPANIDQQQQIFDLKSAKTLTLRQQKTKHQAATCQNPGAVSGTRPRTDVTKIAFGQYKQHLKHPILRVKLSWIHLHMWKTRFLGQKHAHTCGI